MANRFRACSARQNQRGVSLVELMVGLVLSMITVLAAMVAYKALVHNSLSSAASSKAQNVAAGLSIQLSRLLPQAGWGVGATASPAGGAANTDFVLLSGAALTGNSLTGSAVTVDSSARAGNAVVWGSMVNDTMECSALITPRDGGLTVLGPVACANAAAWRNLSWPITTLMASDALPGAAFTARKTDCWPYAAVTGGAPLAVQVVLTGTKSIASSACLTNITN